MAKLTEPADETLPAMVVVPELSPEAPEMLRAEDAMTSIAWLPPEMVTWSPARFTEPLLAVMPVPEAFVTDTVGAVREMTLRSQVPETDFAKMVSAPTFCRFYLFRP